MGSPVWALAGVGQDSAGKVARGSSLESSGSPISISTQINKTKKQKAGSKGTVLRTHTDVIMRTESIVISKPARCL